MGDDASEHSRRLLERVLQALAVAVLAAVAAVANSLPGRYFRLALAVNVALSIGAFIATTSLIHGLGEAFIKGGLKGIDLNKGTTQRDKDGKLVRPVQGVAIPECQGSVSATVFILTMFIFIPFAFAVYDRQRFPFGQLTEYLAAVLTVSFATLMGIADDVLDLRWRHKLPLPFLAVLPLLLVYHVNGKQTGVMIPLQIRAFIGDYIELGPLYYVFLLLLACFSTHAINIYAGVNGLEVGQSVVIGLSVLVLNVTQLHRIDESFVEYREQHAQSLFLILPFLSVSLALLRLNWFPSKVFVGDTYCYFAGMLFAVAAIVGHYSKTMCLLLIPQVLNFLYSSPQLFKFIGIPNPRHRMPDYDPTLGYVKNSYCEFKLRELKPLGRVTFELLRRLRLVHVASIDEEGVVRMSNLTLINFVLYAMGPCREDVLCLRLLLLQVMSSVLCFVIRFGCASYVFDVVL